MGILDWFKGRSRRSSSPDELASVEKDEKPRKDHDKNAKTLKKELEKEEKKNSAQETRMMEMEEKFNVLQEKWAKIIQEQQETVIKLIGDDEADEKGSGSGKRSARTGKKQSTGEGRMLKKFSSPIISEKKFSNFVVDDSNRFPFLAAEAVATGEGRKYNPLFVYGPVGVGKTHLLQAIANRMLELNPKLNVVYSSTERFTDELIRYLSNDDIQGFRQIYSDIDVLLVDDIQMLTGKEAVQREFFHMFNHLFNSGKQIVLCSDRPPSDIYELETRLRSRFEGGLIIDIQVPTFEGRRQILLNLSQRDGFSISTEVLDYLAFYLDTSVRELEGGFNRVTAYASLMKEPITVNLVRKVLDGILQKRDLVKKDITEHKEDHMRYAEEENEKEITSIVTDDLDLEEETDMIEKELLFELKKGAH